MKRPSLLAGSLLILVVGVACYLNSLGGQLFWDDEVTVINNRFIRSPQFLKEIFLSSYHTGGGETVNFYRPLATLSFMLDYRLWALNPFGYHLTNLLLHAANAILLFMVLQRLFKGIGVALLAAILFTVHPVNSEAVNYVSNRTDLLMLFFFLLSVWSYLGYRDRGRAVFLFLSVAGYLGSILSKEMGLVAPLFLIAADLFERRPIRIKPLSGFLGVFVVTSALRATVLNFLHLDLLRQGAQAEPFSQDLLIRFLTFAKAHATYLRLFFLPVNLHMEYDNPVVLSRHDPAGWLAVALLAGFGTLIWLWAKRERRIGLGGGWYFLGLLPIAGIIPVNNVMGEHYLYLASAGFFVIPCVAAFRGMELERRPLLPLAAVSAAVILLGVMTVARNRDWSDPLSMYLNIAHHTRTSFRANNNAGVEYFRRGDAANAELYFKRSLAILPTYAEALNNLGVIEEGKGRLMEAERLYQESVASKPDYPLARKNLAKIYLKLGRPVEARDQLLAALRFFPHDEEARGLLASIGRSE